MDIPRNQIVVGIAKSKSLDGNQRDNERQSKLIHLMLCALQLFDDMSKWKAYSFWLMELTLLEDLVRCKSRNKGLC